MTGRPLRPSLAGRRLGLLAAVVLAAPIVVAVLLLTEFDILIDDEDVADGVESLDDTSPSLDEGTTDVASGPTDAPAAEPERAPPAPPEPAPEPEETTYVVVPGDTLAAIAVRFGTTVTALAAFNAIDNVDALRVGQEIRIPPEGYEPPPPEPERSAPGPPPGG